MTTPDESGRRVPVGVGFAVASALLFGLSTPGAKLRARQLDPDQPEIKVKAGVGCAHVWGPSPNAGAYGRCR